MTRRMFVTGLAVVFLAASVASAEDLKVIKTQKVGDLSVSVLSESGQWKPGKNAFVLELAREGKPVDGGSVALSTSMPMPGMAPMIAGATIQPDAPGRYRGSITFPDAGDRQVAVSWNGPGGKGSTRFTVPVR